MGMLIESFSMQKLRVIAVRLGVFGGGDSHVSLTPSNLDDSVLRRDESAHSISFEMPFGGQGYDLDLNKHKVTIGEGGIWMNGQGTGSNGGVVTSSSGQIKISQRGSVSIHIHAVITDNLGVSVGLYFIDKSQPDGRLGSSVIAGDEYNTFTGTVNVIGNGINLELMKNKGAIAVSGDMNIKEGAHVYTRGSGQFARHVTVTLQSGAGPHHSF